MLLTGRFTGGEKISAGHEREAPPEKERKNRVKTCHYFHCYALMDEFRAGNTLIFSANQPIEADEVRGAQIVEK